RGIDRVLRLVGQPSDLGELGDALMPQGIRELDFNSEEYLAAAIPAANGMFTARSLAQRYAAHARGGQHPGPRPPGRRALRRPTRVRSRGIGRVSPVPMHWRLAYHRVATLGAAVPNGFGHYGFGGSGAFADPDRDLSVALTLNSGVGTPFGDIRIVRIGTAALRCADER